MKKYSKLIQFFSVVCILSLLLSGSVFAQEERKIKMDEYKVQLADWQARESAAKEKVDALTSDNDGLNTQINDTQAQIDATWGEIYALVGTDEAGYEAYHAELHAIEQELDGLGALSPEDLFRKKDEIKALWKRLATAKESKIALLTAMENEIAGIEGEFAALKAKIPSNIYDQYTVVENDNLWKIAKMPDIYDNPLQWIRIYNVNKDQIKNADLIYKEQIFNIARGVADNEHLVQKGEFLFSIAGMAKVFNDPTKWAKLYEANKSIIDDQNLIYPYQVLTIPKQ
jgi:nucleoid-associated protein YgaU